MKFKLPKADGLKASLPPMDKLSFFVGLVWRWLRAAFSQWRLVASALVAAAIIHILVTLSAAQYGEATSYQILARSLPVNQVAFGQPVSSKSQPLPFFSPDALYSYCRYDASTARINLNVKLPSAGWSLSLHTPKGENFYFVAGSDQRETNVKLVLAPPGNVFAHGSIEVTETSQSIPQVKLPAVSGLAVLRAPIKGFAYRRNVDELRAAFSCRAQSAPVVR